MKNSFVKVLKNSNLESTLINSPTITNPNNFKEVKNSLDEILSIVTNEANSNKSLNELQIHKIIARKMAKLEKFNKKLERKKDKKKKVLFCSTQIKIRNSRFEDTNANENILFLKQSNIMAMEMNKKFEQKSKYLQLKRILERFDKKAFANKYHPKYMNHYITIKRFRHNFDF